MSALNRRVLAAYRQTQVCLAVQSRSYARKANSAQKRYYEPQFRSVTDGQQEWRVLRGLSRNPNASGPLADKRDFSYLDGRPAPLGINQAKRILKHKAYADKILQCVAEMDFAVARHQRVLKEEQDRQQAILDSKLKPKGHLLLKKETTV